MNTNNLIPLSPMLPSTFYVDVYGMGGPVRRDVDTGITVPVGWCQETDTAVYNSLEDRELWLDQSMAWNAREDWALNGVDLVQPHLIVILNDNLEIVEKMGGNHFTGSRSDFLRTKPLHGYQQVHLRYKMKTSDPVMLENFELPLELYMRDGGFFLEAIEFQENVCWPETLSVTEIPQPIAA